MPSWPVPFGRQHRYDFNSNLVVHYTLEETVLEVADHGYRLPIEIFHEYLSAYKLTILINDYAQLVDMQAHTLG